MGLLEEHRSGLEEVLLFGGKLKECKWLGHCLLTFIKHQTYSIREMTVLGKAQINIFFPMIAYCMKLILNNLSIISLGLRNGLAFSNNSRVIAWKRIQETGFV